MGGAADTLRARTPFVPDAGNVIGTNRELVADGQVSERLQIGLAEMIVRNIGHRGRSRSWRAAFRKRHGVADLHLHKLDEPLVIAWRRVLAIEVIDDLGQVAGQPLAFGFGQAAPPQQGSAFPDTGQNTLMLPMCALSALRQCKPLESHGLVRTARVHHAAR